MRHYANLSVLHLYLGGAAGNKKKIQKKNKSLTNYFVRS